MIHPGLQLPSPHTYTRTHHTAEGPPFPWSRPTCCRERTVHCTNTHCTLYTVHRMYSYVTCCIAEFAVAITAMELASSFSSHFLLLLVRLVHIHTSYDPPPSLPTTYLYLYLYLYTSHVAIVPYTHGPRTSQMSIRLVCLVQQNKNPNPKQDGTADRGRSHGHTARARVNKKRERERANPSATPTRFKM